MGAFKKVHQNFERLTGDFFCRLAREREREREREHRNFVQKIEISG